MDVRVYQGLSLEEYANIIRNAIAQHKVVLILASCSVDYEGRGASTLGEGERIIIVKNDWAFLVHRPSGYSPVNWQPQSSIIEVSVQGGLLVIKAVRARPHEVVTVRISDVALVIVSSPSDVAEFVEYMSEHDIRDLLARHPEIIEDGLTITSIEKPVEPGFVDLYGVDKDGKIVVIELKRVTATKDAVNQLYRYVQAVKKSLGKEVRGILAAPNITKSALELLERLGLEYKQLNLKRLRGILDREKEKTTRSGVSLLEFISKGKR